jgi:hypothetical protein
MKYLPEPVYTWVSELAGLARQGSPPITTDMLTEAALVALREGYADEAGVLATLAVAAKN